MKYFLILEQHEIALLPAELQAQLMVPALAAQCSNGIGSAPAAAPAEPAATGKGKGKGKAKKAKEEEPATVEEAPAPQAPQAALFPNNSTVLPTMKMEGVQIPQAPAKQPIVQGNVHIFPPSMGHPTQMTGAVDVLTGQPVSIPTPSSAPPMPQNLGAPVSVVPTAAPIQQQPVASMQMPAVSGNDAKQMAMQAWNGFKDPMVGQAVVNHACAQSGAGNAAGINDQNASAFAFHLQQAVQSAQQQGHQRA